MTTYHVPEILYINSIEILNDDYTYASIKTTLGDRMIFDKEDKLYFVEY